MNQVVTQSALAPTAQRIKFDLMDPRAFDHIQRVAKLYANSPLFPEHLRKGGTEQAIANAVLVMNIAERLREDPLTVGQNIYFVSGRPGWSATYMIAKANQHGVFKGPIEWEVTGTGEKLSVTAFATMADSKRRVEMTTTFETAKKEGWTRNTKYQSMPEIMLRYRSATALIRAYCPEVMIGLPPANEVEDEQAMRDVTPAYPDPEPEQKIKTPVPEVEDAETVEDEAPKPSARGKVDRTPPKPAVKPEPEPEPEADEAETASETPHDEDGVVTEDEAEPEPKQEKVEDKPAKAAPKGDSDKYEKMVKRINDELEMSNGDEQGVCGFYAGDLATLEAESPEHYAQVHKAIRDYRAQP